MSSPDIKNWPKSITVDKRIVRILSESTYENFPNALRELVTNSYDADASRVEIYIDVKNEKITISDNGVGMSNDEFAVYLKIAGFSRERKPTTNSGRKRVGQFGVGFLSSFPFCKNYSVESKKRGGDEILFASIPCHKYFSGGKLVDISAIGIEGGTRVDHQHNVESYTRFELSGFTELTKAFFFPTHEIAHLRNSIQKSSVMTRLIWRLSEDLPVQFEWEDDIVKKHKEIYEIFSLFSPNMAFDVFLNGQKIERKFHGKEILEIGDEQTYTLHGTDEVTKSQDFNGDIKFKYFISTNKRSLSPYEARYLKLRNLNVGVGGRTTFGLGTKFGGARSRLHWLTGEVFITEGLNNKIAVSRSGFNFSQNYEILKLHFVKKLASWSNRLEREATIARFIAKDVHGNSISNLALLKRIGGKMVEIRVGEEEKVQVGKWEARDSDSPAVRRSAEGFEVNEGYPLFTGSKYTDIFIRIHLLLLKQFEAGNLSLENMREMNNDLLDIYRDYLK